ncbi:MAG TPA: glycosyltransferase family 1 protein [Anaerolineales bacterium]
MTRNIVINGRFLARRVTGVERYGHEILRFIGSNSRVESTRRQGWRGHAWEQLTLPAKLNSHSILWSPANTGPLMVRDQALTIHDLSSLEHPEWFRGSFAIWYRLFLPILARRVRKIFTPSEYVKQKVMRRFGIKDVTVTPNGIDPFIFHPDTKQKMLDLPKCYILFVGCLEPRKNLDLLLSAWNEIKSNFKETWLTIVGVSGNVFKPVKFAPEVERVRFLGYVEDEALAGLYANAVVLVLPSQDEGFGLPALEAMASGTPVIVSDGGALPETVGDAGLIFCLSNPFGLSNSLKECMSNAHLRSDLREKGLARAKQFSWQTTAELVWKHLNEL